MLKIANKDRGITIYLNEDADEIIVYEETKEWKQNKINYINYQGVNMETVKFDYNDINIKQI